MTPGEALDQVRAALGQEGFVEEADEEPTFHGTVAAAGRAFSVSIAFPCLRFTRLPVVRLLRRAEELPGVRAHVERDDRLCYAVPGLLVLDMHEPGNNALTVLGTVRDALERTLGEAAEADLLAEFPQHWMGGNVHVALPLGAGDGPAALLGMPRPGAAPLLILTWPVERGGGFVGGAMGRLAGRPLARAWVLRTDLPLQIAPGSPLPASYRDLLNWAATVDPVLPPRMRRAARDEFFREDVYLFVAAPNGWAGARLILPPLWKKSCRRKEFWAKILVDKAAEIRLELLSGTRMDAELARTRNLENSPSLAGRSIVLIGCGTIGGHLARFLVQSGAGDRGRLLLFDDDTLAAGNLGRHLLGSGHIGSNKALACAEEIGRHFPYANVQGFAERIQERPGVLATADLVIDATGEEALSRALNHEVLIRRPGGPAAIFVWLVGQGAAAEALYVPSRADGRGCLACRRPHGAAQPVMRPGAAPRIAPAACGEAAFVPYGVAAPAIAAGLAARMAVEWAGGDVKPSFRCVRVDHTTTQLVADEDVAMRGECTACGRGSRAA